MTMTIKAMIAAAALALAACAPPPDTSPPEDGKTATSMLGIVNSGLTVLDWATGRLP